MVGGNAEMGFEISNEENQGDDKGRNGEAFEGDSFHGSNSVDVTKTSGGGGEN